jgi:hypothetical protein
MGTPGEVVSWAVWIRRGRRHWRLYGRAATEQAAERLAAKIPPGLDKLIRQGDADPNEDGRPRETTP